MREFHIAQYDESIDGHVCMGTTHAPQQRTHYAHVYAIHRYIQVCIPHAHVYYNPVRYRYDVHVYIYLCTYMYIKFLYDVHI